MRPPPVEDTYGDPRLAALVGAVLERLPRRTLVGVDRVVLARPAPGEPDAGNGSSLQLGEEGARIVLFPGRLAPAYPTRRECYAAVLEQLLLRVARHDVLRAGTPVGRMRQDRLEEAAHELLEALNGARFSV
jgi:hypothetical protein